MAEYIEREKAKAVLNERYKIRTHMHDLNSAAQLKSAEMEIGDISAADVRPVVRGKWRLGGYGQISNATEKWYDKYLQGGFLYCSVCKGRTSVKYNFCPNCGADMRDANDEKA